jgi:hypothetical protein
MRDQLQGVSGLEAGAVAASWTVVDDRLTRWWAGFDDAFALVAGRFAQVDARRRARMYLLSLRRGRSARTPGHLRSRSVIWPRMGCSDC